MTFKLANCGHTHTSVLEAKMCIGLISAPKVYSPPPVPFKDQPGTMSYAQDKFLRSLGATQQHLVNGSGARLSMNEASRLIDDFKKGRVRVTLPIEQQDPRLDFVKGLIDMVPEGYYATQRAEGETVHFLRISRPVRNRYAGTIKFQTVLGSYAGTRLEDAAILWPSGRWSLSNKSIVESLMLVVADPFEANRLYAKKIGRCCRCNASLTDERSRHYGIGPECVKVWPEIVVKVDEEDELARQSS